MIPKIAVTPRGIGFYLPIACLLTAIGGLLLATPRGLGLQDEIYYIDYIYCPNGFAAIATLFGNFFGILYRLFDLSIIELRILCVCFIGSAGALLGYSTERYFFDDWQPNRRHLFLVFGTLGSFLYYIIWILTPSYNVLANAGGQLTMSAALIWGGSRNKHLRFNYVACGLAGIGGALAFLGKAPSAAIAAVMTIGFLVIHFRKRPIYLAGNIIAPAVISALTLVVIIRWSMPVDMALRHLAIGRDAIGHDWSIMSVLRRTIKGLISASPILYLSIAICVFAIFHNKERHRRIFNRLAMYIVLLMIVDIVLLVWLIIFGIVSNTMPFGAIPVFGVYAISFAILQLAYAFSAGRPGNRSPTVIIPILVLLSLPFLTAIGSSNPFLTQSNMSLYAIPLTGVLIAHLWFSPRWIPAVQIGWAILVVMTLIWSALSPYSHRSILEQSHPISLPFTKDFLYVDMPTAKFVTDIHKIAQLNAFIPGTPVLDLSGVSPAVAPLLGGRAPFYPWLIDYLVDPARIPSMAWQSMTSEQRRHTWIIGPVDATFLKNGALVRLIRGHYVKVAIIPFRALRNTPPLTFWKPVEDRVTNSTTLSSGKM